MSGSIIFTPAVGADWVNAWQQVEYARKGKLGLSLTNYDNNNLPQIASGSWAEVAGSIYQWSANDSISGTPSSGNINYIKLVPGGSGDSAYVTPTWTTSAPTWSDTYQGWYDGTSRYVAGCYYDGTNYTGKWVYRKGDSIEHTGGPKTLKCKVIEIGDWNMHASNSGTNRKDVPHGLTKNKIRCVCAILRGDEEIGGKLYFFTPGNYAAPTSTLACIYEIDDTYVVLYITTGKGYDSEYYDQTDYNRGWVTIWYEA